MRPNPPLLAPRALLLALLPLLAACDHPFGIGRAWIDGTWIYQAETISQGGADCTVTPLTLSLDQEGDAFSGVVEGGQLTCTTAEATVTRSLGGAPITSGDVDGDRVAFVIGAGVLSHDGRVESRSMRGSVRISLEVDGEPIELEGPFVAARAPRGTGDGGT